MTFLRTPKAYGLRPNTIGLERVYIVRDRDTASRAIFESRGFQPAASGAHYVVYVNRIEALGVRRSDVRP